MKRFLLSSLMLLSCWGPFFAQLPGDLVISEYMANPEEVTNEQGEYIELFNTTFYPVNLNGCVIQDASNLYIALNTDLYVYPGEFAVVGASAVPYAHYYYPASPPPFSLNNLGGDQITVTCGGTLIAGTNYSGSQPAGVSMELSATHLHSNGITQEGHYVPSSTPFRYNGTSRNDYGSPGHAGNTFVLPVELAGFEARVAGRQVLLRWNTLSENNNSHFVVEHATDGQPFLPIGRLSGAGDSQEPRQYEFLHDEPEFGTNYYRLQQVDFDGASSHSEILAVELNSRKEPLRLYPTAVDHTLTIEWPQEPRQPLTLTIFDLQGRLATNIELTAQGRRTQLSVEHLPPGTYVLSVPQGRDVQQGRFFKK
ncbi:MAG: lamin tail domain-containing protein [Phaeodactylibacter sp.]|nr:lamin tail domain-containing protein [Phaeodactylibacter sp.]